MEENQEIEVSQIHTVCRDCVFAKYDGENPNKQSGCSLNKIQDYEKAGVPVIEVFDDSNKEFKLINGRFCMFYRNEEVMKAYSSSTWQDIVKLQTKVPYHAIVFFDKDSKYKELKKTLLSLQDQEVSPNLVTVFNMAFVDYSEEEGRGETVAPSKLLELLQSFNFHQYSLKNVYDQNLDKRDLTDLAFDNNKEKPYPFYTTFDAGFLVPKDFSKELNDAILIDMKQIGFVKSVEGINGMIVNKTTHKKHGGNSFHRNLEDKVLEFEEDAEKFIYESSEVVPCLSKK
jgi:hypothetical protein